MKLLNKIPLWIAIIFLIFGVVFFLYHLFSNNDVKGDNAKINLAGTAFTGAGAILIWAVFNEQQKLIKKQQFESTFFNMINVYHELKNSSQDIFLINGEKKECKGTIFFKEVISSIKKWHKDPNFQKSIERRKDIPEIIEYLEKKRSQQLIDANHYMPFYEFYIGVIENIDSRSKEFYVAIYEYYFSIYQAQLSHFFRFIYNIINFTLEERSKAGDQQRYINLIQAQMSNYELGLLFYNALSKHGISTKGESKLYKWLDEYNFFQNIDPEVLVNRNNHKFYTKRLKFMGDKDWAVNQEYNSHTEHPYVTFLPYLNPSQP